MANWFFDAPAGMQDFQDPQQWHKAMQEEAEGIILLLVASVLGKDPNDVTPQDIQQVSPELAYVNPVVDSIPANAQTVGVAPWGGFPRAVERRAPWQFSDDPDDPQGIYRAVEVLGNEDFPRPFTDFNGQPLNLPVRHRQDEYLEWTVRRDAAGKMTKAIFVAEGYDYYAALFRHDEQKVVEMYREFTGVSTIKADDLRAINGIKVGNRVFVPKGAFNPRNRFNIDPGIVHLSHNANSLGAEVNLAGVSALARKKVDGTVLPTGNAELLLCCSQGGNPNRNSDPLIGQQAYAQVLEKRRYTLANPVGLYIAGVEDTRLTLPNGDPAPREWWKVVRGHDLWTPGQSRVLRLELEVPASEGISLGDLQVDGNPLKFGGQLAQLLSVHLFITRWSRTDNSIGPVVGCDATCCRKNGTEQLVLSGGQCQPGFTLAFPGLVAQQAGFAAPAIETAETSTINFKSRL